MNEIKETLILCIGGLIGSIFMFLYFLNFLELPHIVALGIPTLLIVMGVHSYFENE